MLCLLNIFLNARTHTREMWRKGAMRGMGGEGAKTDENENENENKNEGTCC